MSETTAATERQQGEEAPIIIPPSDTSVLPDPSSSSSSSSTSSTPTQQQDPFRDFTISDDSAITHLHDQPRVQCPSCSKARKLFCPACGIPLGHVPPKVSLPIDVIIVRDPRETEAKSTSVHAQILAKDNVAVKVENIVRLPGGKQREEVSVAHYHDPERVLLLFPSDDALPLAEIPDLSRFDRLVVLDGTWRQGRAMAGSIASLPFQHVKIATRTTLFWRYQPFGDHCLSTIEAIYWFFRDYHAAACKDEVYDGRYDDLLWYFRMQWRLIQDSYRNNPEKTFTDRKLDAKAYIRY
ncbi:DTW domain-containing protein 1 [Thoreauomyces humboldtii]|nr:DTW domain-containing protein 1 [Thoreauomyces humboldtii]